MKISPSPLSSSLPDHIKPIEKAAEIHATVPANNMQAEIEAELAILNTESMQETIEEMSLLFGSRWRDEKRGKERLSERNQARVLHLFGSLSPSSSVSEHLKTTLSEPDISKQLNAIIASNLPTAQQMAQLAGLWRQCNETNPNRRYISDRLQALLNKDGWEVALFGILEFDKLPADGLGAVRALFQQSLREGGMSIAAWFDQVRRWPERRKRIRVLLRALAYSLSVNDAQAERIRIANVIAQLRRLSLFLSLEADSQCVDLFPHSQIKSKHQEKKEKEKRKEEQEAKEIQTAEENTDTDQTLIRIIAIIEQPWIFCDWLIQTIDLHKRPMAEKIPYLNQLYQLFSRLPDACFNEPDQRNQIHESLLEAINSLKTTTVQTL
ncbi:MAG: TyeA family type III secretion system gatekeeper subunit [Plesiomonas sp.]